MQLGVTAKGPSGSEAMRGLKGGDSKDETQGVCVLVCVFLDSPNNGRTVYFIFKHSTAYCRRQRFHSHWWLD